MRPPVPPFTEATARQKVQAAEDAWNTRDLERVAAAYTEDSRWRNRDEWLTGRSEIIEFLAPQVGARAPLCASQGPLGVHGRPDRRALPVRVS
jgi:nuclear transport factor 2 (NTF2) superfamily protein